LDEGGDYTEEDDCLRWIGSKINKGDK